MRRLELLFAIYVTAWVILTVWALSAASQTKPVPKVEPVYVPYCMGASGRGMCKDVPYMGRA